MPGRSFCAIEPAHHAFSRRDDGDCDHWATTAVFAGVVSLTQSDIKKILAYSTMSQIGFMIMACGLGAFVVAIFHLLAHGCYKAFFFLSTGNALQSVQTAREHGEAPPRGPGYGPLVRRGLPVGVSASVHSVFGTV